MMTLYLSRKEWNQARLYLSTLPPSGKIWVEEQVSVLKYAISMQAPDDIIEKIIQHQGFVQRGILSLTLSFSTETVIERILQCGVHDDDIYEFLTLIRIYPRLSKYITKFPPYALTAGYTALVCDFRLDYTKFWQEPRFIPTLRSLLRHGADPRRIVLQLSPYELEPRRRIDAIIQYDVYVTRCLMMYMSLKPTLPKELWMLVLLALGLSQ